MDETEPAATDNKKAAPVPPEPASNPREAPPSSGPPRPDPHCHPAAAQACVADIMQRIAAHRGRPLFVLVADYIDGGKLAEVYKWRRELKRVASDGQSLDVLIDSPGGALTSAYLLARMLSRYVPEWNALVPTLAASGATLICLGSHSIVMSDIAQLGPVDPQVFSKRRDKFFAAERQSPLEAFKAVMYVRTLALSTVDAAMMFLQEPNRGVAPLRALETATQISSQLVQPLLGRIEPYDLGAFALDSELALQYCHRIARPDDPTRQSQRSADYRVLVERYPAHEFAIDREEAGAIGFNIAGASAELDVLFDELRPVLVGVDSYIGMA